MCRLRDNILFGLPFEESRYWGAVRAACLEPDLALLAGGDMTELGELGSLGFRVYYYFTLNPKPELGELGSIRWLVPQKGTRLKGNTQSMLTKLVEYLN